MERATLMEFQHK